MQDAQANNMMTIVYLHAPISQCVTNVARFCCPASSEFGYCSPYQCQDQQRGWRDFCERPEEYKTHGDCMADEDCMDEVNNFEN